MALNDDEIRSIREQIVTPLTERFDARLGEMRREHRRHAATMARRERRTLKRVSKLEDGFAMLKRWRTRIRATYAVLAFVLSVVMSFLVDRVKAAFTH